MNQPPIVECPTCGVPVEWKSNNKCRPFCSDRCKLVDLGAWAAEGHVIPGDTLEDDALPTDLPPRGH